MQRSAFWHSTSPTVAHTDPALHQVPRWVSPERIAQECRASGSEASEAGAFHAPPASRTRSLLRDMVKALGMQMRYWGMDARGGTDSLLVAAGLQRLPRAVSIGEGSSRYRQSWEGGWIEIHSFCAGFYHPTKRGILFSRADRRISCSTLGGVAEPLHHREHDAATPPDATLQALPPFLHWILDYESRITVLAGSDYRLRCWQQLGGAKFGPQPCDLHSWFAALLINPASTPRLKASGRRSEKILPSHDRRSLLFRSLNNSDRLAA